MLCVVRLQSSLITTFLSTSSWYFLSTELNLLTEMECFHYFSFYHHVFLPLLLEERCRPVLEAGGDFKSLLLSPPLTLSVGSSTFSRRTLLLFISRSFSFLSSLVTTSSSELTPRVSRLLGVEENSLCLMVGSFLPLE